MQLSTITHWQTHKQLPWCRWASCLKGVLRERVLIPNSLLHQRHLALSQPITTAINHAWCRMLSPMQQLSPSPPSPGHTRRTPDWGNSVFSTDIPWLANSTGHSDLSLTWKTLSVLQTASEENWVLGQCNNNCKQNQKHTHETIRERSQCARVV